MASLQGTNFGWVLNMASCAFDNLGGAILNGCDFTGADVSGFDLTGAREFQQIVFGTGGQPTVDVAGCTGTNSWPQGQKSR